MSMKAQSSGVTEVDRIKRWACQVSISSSTASVGLRDQVERDLPALRSPAGIPGSAGVHIARVNRDDLVIEPSEVNLALRHQYRLEGAARSRGTEIGSGPCLVLSVLVLLP